MRIFWFNRFLQTTQVLPGVDTLALIGDMVQDAGYKKAFIVHGGSAKKNGSLDIVTNALDEAGIEYCCYDKVEPDPPADLVDEGAALARKAGCDCVIAIGGGSALDMGKCINMLRENEGSIMNYLAAPGKQVHGMFCIPTTSGTGSEMTNAAVVSANGMKNTVMTGVPDYALIDPKLTVSLPASQTLYTGLDVFSHAAEAYTSAVSALMTDAICEKTMEMVVENLPKALKDGTDMEARTKMSIASALGGFNILNGCCHMGHSFAHVVGGKTHIPHGALLGYDLPVLLKFIAPALPQKVQRIGEILGAKFSGSETPEQIGEKAAAAYKTFAAGIGLKPFASWNIAIEDFDALADLCMSEALVPAWPVPTDHDTVVTLLKEMLA